MIPAVILPDRRMSQGRVLMVESGLGCSMSLPLSPWPPGLFRAACRRQRRTSVAIGALGRLRAASSHIRLKLAALDHAHQLRRNIGILAVEHIEQVTELAFAPVDLVNQITQCERTQYDRDDLAQSVKHSGPPASALPADDARHFMEEYLHRADDPLATELAANFRLQIR